MEIIFHLWELKRAGHCYSNAQLFLLFRKFFAKYVFALLMKLSKKTRTIVFSQIFLAFEKPIQWLFIIMGIYVSALYFPLFNHANPLFLKVIRASIIVVINWGILI